MKRSALTLVGLGLAGALFFWLTDPRYGLMKGSAATITDRANDAFVGTIVGVAGSVLVLIIGLYLATRRMA
ncbi:MAG: hypothetical protein IT447_08000 [Phycisphaerales bacterium]|jgi:hypothetical protein|nr:hypothetical protein [Phycisphaerales bacterium]